MNKDEDKKNKLLVGIFWGMIVLFLFAAITVGAVKAFKVDPLDAFTVSKTCTWLTMQGDIRIFCPDGTYVAIPLDINAPLAP